MNYPSLIKRQLQQLGKLPQPTQEAITHSCKLHEYLLNLFSQNEGAIPFDQFMQQALYAPGMGYYSAGAEKIGASGDFITAPEISPLFSEAIAQQVDQILSLCGKEDGTQADILEFGAGRGIMAVDILKRLDELSRLPENYYILEVSAELKQRQKNTIQKNIPELAYRVIWLDSLPNEGFQGVILANEVVDAMPITLFEKKKQKFIEKSVDWKNGCWQFQDSMAENPKLQQWGLALETRLDCNFAEGYISERNPRQNAWMESLAKILVKGMVLIIDYGFSEKEYYHPQRQGTLMCHYRHFVHDNPLVLLGLQDITAHVDFTSLAQTAFESGLQVHGFTDQGTFLTNCGILKRMEQLGGIDDEKISRYSQQIKLLILPSEMGELFKVIAMTKGCQNETLIGFQFGDKRSRL